jgi:hypothetical protein
VTRRGAVKARTQTTNQLKSLLVTAPPEVRERLQDLKDPRPGAGVCAAADIRPAVESSLGGEGGVASAGPPPPGPDHR